jgi:hypothetical protein
LPFTVFLPAILDEPALRPESSSYSVYGPLPGLKRPS